MTQKKVLLWRWKTGKNKTSIHPEAWIETNGK
jgi:hypothetical protein